MKKVVLLTLILGLNALVVMGGLKLRESFKTTSYDFNTTKIEKLFVRINHSFNKEKSINKTIDIKTVKHSSKDELASVEGLSLSLKSPVKRRVVVLAKENQVSKTNWASLFETIKLKEVKVELAIANTTSPLIKSNNEKRIKEESKKIINQPTTERMDRISTALSATEKSKVTEVKKTANENYADLEFYDYSSSNKKVEDTNAKFDKSKVYQQRLETLKNGKSLLSLLGKKVAPKNKPVIPTPEPTPNPGPKPGRAEKAGTHESEYSLSTYSVDFLNMTTQDHTGFEVDFSDDEQDSIKDYGNGIISLEYLLNTPMTVRRGEIHSMRHYPTAMDFVFEEGSISISVPLFKRKEFDQLLANSKIKGLGGHILVELDEKTEDVELSAATKYEEKVYLDKNLRVVSRDDSDFNYIMFLGVKAGNSIIYFRTLSNKVLSKIIHIKEEVIYYEPNFYTEQLKDEYSVYEDNLLGKDLTSLNVHAKEIKNFSSDYSIENLSFNRLGVKKAIYPTGTRKYQEFKHLNESVFVGRWNEDYIDLPSEEYMRFVLRQFDQQAVNNSCLIQVNLSKAAKSLSYNGLSEKGLYVRSAILDKDGQFYDDLSFQSKKIFLMGENQGVINLKVSYTDGSVDFLQSYCSESTYLVEQL